MKHSYNYSRPGGELEQGENDIDGLKRMLTTVIGY